MNTQVLQQPTIEHGTITVAHIFPAKAPGQSAWIKDSHGIMFGFRPEKMGGILRDGETYAIEFTANVKNGTTYRDIKQARVATPPGPAPEQFTASHQPARSLSSAATESPRATSPNGNAAGQYYRPTSPRDSERMFVCSTLNAFIGTGRIDCARDHLSAAINELRAAYAATFGADDH